MNTGDRIKQLRNEKGLTQEELGDLLGVKKAAIQKYENGAIVNLKVDTIKKLSDIFKVSPNYIIGWEFEDPKNIENKSKFFNQIIIEHFGGDALETLKNLYILNVLGRNKIKEYSTDITMISDYRDTKKIEKFKKELAHLFVDDEMLHM